MDLQQIADGWVEEFSVDPYVLRERQMDAWFRLDGLIHKQPLDALLVFQKVAAKDLINWTFEGFAVGPLRTFLMVYGDRYDAELAGMRQQSAPFDEMYRMAAEGL